MRWLWPVSWYYRIRALEGHVEALKVENRHLDGLVRAQAIAQTSITAAYVASVASMAAVRTRFP